MYRHPSWVSFHVYSKYIFGGASCCTHVHSLQYTVTGVQLFLACILCLLCAWLPTLPKYIYEATIWCHVNCRYTMSVWLITSYMCIHSTLLWIYNIATTYRYITYLLAEANLMAKIAPKLANIKMTGQLEFDIIQPIALVVLGKLRFH